MNPLFTPRPKVAPGPSRFSTEAGELSFLVPAEWSGKGRIQVEKPNNRYVVFDLAGPDDAVIFSGHPDLPQRYFVPGPWHGHVQPGRRTRFGEGATEQWLFPGAATSAPQMGAFLAARRFGQVDAVSATPLPDLIAEVWRGAGQAGASPGFVDACTVDFASTDRLRVGMIRLAVFGGGNPGDTWQVEFISGYWCATAARDEVAGLYDQVMASVTVGQDWRRDNPDTVSQAVHDRVDDAFRAADKLDAANLNQHRRDMQGIKEGILASIKGRPR